MSKAQKDDRTNGLTELRWAFRELPDSSGQDHSDTVSCEASTAMWTIVVRVESGKAGTENEDCRYERVKRFAFFGRNFMRLGFGIIFLELQWWLTSPGAEGTKAAEENDKLFTLAGRREILIQKTAEKARNLFAPKSQRR